MLSPCPVTKVSCKNCKHLTQPDPFSGSMVCINCPLSNSQALIVESDEAVTNLFESNWRHVTLESLCATKLRRPSFKSQTLFVVQNLKFVKCPQKKRSKNQLKGKSEQLKFCQMATKISKKKIKEPIKVCQMTTKISKKKFTTF